MALLAVAVGCLFTRDERVKIVAMSTLLSQIAVSSNSLLSDHQTGVCNLKISPGEEETSFIRSQNGNIRCLLISCIVAPLLVILSSLFGFASRAPFPGLKQKVNMKQLSPFWFSGLAVITGDIQARRISQRDNTGKLLNIDDVTNKRFYTAAVIALASMLAILVGTVVFRTGLFSKMPTHKEPLALTQRG
jgi:hypothetical protein